MILLGAGHDVRPDSFAVSLSPTVGSGTQWSGVLCHHLREGGSPPETRQTASEEVEQWQQPLLSVVIQRRVRKGVA